MQTSGKNITFRIKYVHPIWAFTLILYNLINYYLSCDLENNGDGFSSKEPQDLFPHFPIFRLSAEYLNIQSILNYIIPLSKYDTQISHPQGVTEVDNNPFKFPNPNPSNHPSTPTKFIILSLLLRRVRK